MPKVYNMKHKDAPATAVYVGRPGYFGNPFSVGVHGRATSIEMYHIFTLNSPTLVERIKTDLVGKDLICWCAPAGGVEFDAELICHGQLIGRIANS